MHRTPALILALLATPAFGAKIYQCVDENGHTTLGNAPCPSGSTTQRSMDRYGTHSVTGPSPYDGSRLNPRAQRIEQTQSTRINVEREAPRLSNEMSGFERRMLRRELDMRRNEARRDMQQGGDWLRGYGAARRLEQLDDQRLRTYE